MFFGPAALTANLNTSKASVTPKQKSCHHEWQIGNRATQPVVMGKPV
jgi:hypothetical protein